MLSPLRTAFSAYKTKNLVLFILVTLLSFNTNADSCDTEEKYNKWIDLKIKSFIDDEKKNKSKPAGVVFTKGQINYFTYLNTKKIRTTSAIKNRCNTTEEYSKEMDENLKENNKIISSLKEELELNKSLEIANDSPAVECLSSTAYMDWLDNKKIEESGFFKRHIKKGTHPNKTKVNTAKMHYLVLLYNESLHADIGFERSCSISMDNYHTEKKKIDKQLEIEQEFVIELKPWYLARTKFPKSKPAAAGSKQQKLRYTSELHWYLTHNCSTAQAPGLRVGSTPISIRFFEAMNGERTGETWPDEKEKVYSLEGHSLFKNTEIIRVNCAYGTQVCYGAELDDNNSTGRWGVGINGEEECSSCCFPCPSGSWKDVRMNLSCN